MSWFSNLVHDVVNGVEGMSNGPIVKNPTTPVGSAVNALGAAVNTASQAISATGQTAITSVLASEGVTEGETLADTLIMSVIEAGVAKLSPALQTPLKAALSTVGTALEQVGKSAAAQPTTTTE
jgi:hypothetical protein